MPTGCRTLKTLSALSLVLLQLLISGCQDQPRLSALDPDAVIVAFGDSLTYGTGAGPEQSYPVRLESLIGRKIVNAGIPGELSGEGLRRLPAVLARYRPALLILCHGGNDLLRRHSTDRTAENIREMVRLARERGVEVALIGVPQLGFLLDTAPFYGEVAEEMALPFEGDILADILTDRELKSDAIHPNAEGYRKLAHAIADLLEEAKAL